MNAIAMKNLEKFENEVTRMFTELKTIMTSDTEECDRDSHYPFFNGLTYTDGILLTYLGEYLKKFCHTTKSDCTNCTEENQYRYIWIISGLFKKTFSNLTYEVYYDKESYLWSLKYTPLDHVGNIEEDAPKVTIHYNKETNVPLLEDNTDITLQLTDYNTTLIIKSLSSIFERPLPLYLKSTYDKVILNMMGYLISLMKINLS